jgi:aspartyl-tRNA(Asn)/glutamyl-tRNA(Gln) amidotransferase subunit C
MTVTADDVRHVAALAKLELSDAQVERFARELGAILEYVDMLAEVGTEEAAVDGTATLRAAFPGGAFLDGAPRATLAPDEALANAPDRDGDEFRVPGFLPE